MPTTTIAQLPPYFDQETGSYIGLLTDALGQLDLAVANDRYLSQCAERADELDLVHLHWLEYVAGLDSGGPVALARSLVRSARFVRDVWRLRRAGVGIVWTAHNLKPHEPRQPLIEASLNALAVRVSDAVIVHSEYARERFEAAHPAARGKTTVIPHGNYIGVYPEREPPPARSGEPFEFLCFGQVRPYKRLPEVIRAFRALPDEDVRLVIAGKPVSDEELVRLRDAAGDDPRIVIDARRISVEDVAALHRRADAAVFAYREVFSSGALVLALSFGVPVVVPDVGASTELARPPACEPFAPGALTEALARMRRGDHPARAAAALASVQGDTWPRVATATAEIYRRVIRERRRRSKRQVAGAHAAGGW